MLCYFFCMHVIYVVSSRSLLLYIAFIYWPSVSCQCFAYSHCTLTHNPVKCRNLQQIVGENPDKDKIVAEYQKRLHRSLNSKNIGLYVKAFMK